MTYQVVLNDKFIFVQSNQPKEKLKHGIQSFFKSYESLLNKDMMTYLETNGIDAKIVTINDFNIIQQYEQGDFQVIVI